MRRFVAIAAASLALSGAALAGDTGAKATSQVPAFSEADANKNGLISRDEADRIQALKEQFSQVDADKDGNLTLAEYQKTYQKVPTG
jgi:Ca2+-binding EF-hand superfamily protein